MSSSFDEVWRLQKDSSVTFLPNFGAEKLNQLKMQQCLLVCWPVRVKYFMTFEHIPRGV